MKKLNAKLAIPNSDRATIYNTDDCIEFYHEPEHPLTNTKTAAARQEVICYAE